MDQSRFDIVARSLAQAPTRRSIVALLAGSVFGLLPLDEIDAKRKKNKKLDVCLNGQDLAISKKKKLAYLKLGATIGACPTAPPPPPPPTCSDGVKNGSETDVDCGGSCPRCAGSRTCSTRADCATALCAGGVCTACTPGPQCGSDANGPCSCFAVADPANNTCVSNQGDLVDSCNQCPSDQLCIPSIPFFNCVPRCGAAS